MAARILMLALCLGVSWAQYNQYQQTTPVPILKQINRHNEDGSYSYGYEAADGSFKIETKHPSGEVFGKYGYVDDTGKVREIEYGASRRGFEPAGTGINVPPPTINANANSVYSGPEDYDDGQYREDPSIYWKDPKYNAGGSSKPTYSAPPAQPAYRPAPQANYYKAPAAPAPPQQNYYNPPAPQPNYYNAPPQSHQAIKNIDYITGSYSVTYKKK